MPNNRALLPSGPQAVIQNLVPAANNGVSRPSTAASTNSSVSVSSSNGPDLRRRGPVKEHFYTETESRIILQAHEEFDQGALPEWDTKSVLQQRLATFFTRENPQSPVSANSVLGRYNRMTKPAGKDKKIQPPQKINGQWLESGDRATYARAIGRDLDANSASG